MSVLLIVQTTVDHVEAIAYDHRCRVLFATDAAQSIRTIDDATAPGADPLTMGYSDAAAKLGIGTRSLRRLVEQGDLPTVRVGKRPRIASIDLMRYIDGLPRDSR